MRKYIIILALVVIFGLIQFIRPERNLQTNPSRYDIFYLTETEGSVISTFQTACYNCHSSNTAYPWYASVAPVSWALNSHINNGKKKLNFSDWILYDKEQQIKLLLDISEVLTEQEMPPKPYTWLHAEARLTDANRMRLNEWVNSKKDEIKASLN
ncbi:MAG: heme-binding domain-containing protein [Bacteroidetes bacterium]|nr:heme-binding domain-containing protein [Bacteroidota bacterium]